MCDRLLTLTAISNLSNIENGQLWGGNHLTRFVSSWVSEILRSVNLCKVSTPVDVDKVSEASDILFCNDADDSSEKTSLHSVGV